MAGHSKWHQIRHKKGANDAKRGKVFTKHARLIAIAAKGGADPDQNPQLRAAIDVAKADNVPNDNIDRAIKKGSGEGGDEAQLLEITYEGYGPGGVALMIQAVTDNRNRSVANIRAIMTKNGGNLGESGSVGYMFEKKGWFEVDVEGRDLDELELELIECEVDDVVREDDGMEVLSSPDQFFAVKQNIEKAGITIKEGKLTLIPTNKIEVSDAEIAQNLLNLVELLEEDDDVMEVITNADIPEEVLSKLE